ncbi:MAG: hypothetical protein QM820_62505 [Minicystis sp.]
MKSRIKENLAAWTAVGFTVLTHTACSVSSGPSGPDPGNTSAGTGAGPAACTSAELVPTARFAPTNGPDLRSFKAITATPSVVLATTGTGIHRSKDGGETWAYLEAEQIHNLEVYAVGALGSEVFASAGGGIYRSVDGGDTWTDVTTVGCGVASYFSAHGLELYIIAGGQPFHWNAATLGWDALPTGESGFDVIESDGTYLYANSMYSPGVYRLRLDDPEAAWTPVETLPAWGYHAFAFTAGHGFAANAEGIFQSADGGVTWGQIAMGDTVDVADLLVDGSTVYAATSKGLMVSSDQGKSWKKAWEGTFASGLALTSDGKHVFAASDGIRRAGGANAGWERLHVLADSITWLTPTETAVLAVSNTSFMRSADGGATWVDVVVPEDFYHLGAPLVVRNKKVFGLGATNKLLVSNDDGASFQALSLPSSVETGWVTLVATVDAGLVLGVSLATGTGCTDAQDISTTLYLSKDDGKTWSKAMNGFPTTFTDCYGNGSTPMITNVVQSGATLFATTYHDGAFLSKNGGMTWKPVKTPADLGFLHDFVTAGDSIFAAAQLGGVVRSTDGGATWEKAGLPALVVSSFAVVDDVLFAGVGTGVAGEDGVYATTDQGLTWTRVDAGFNARIGPLAAQGGHLFAGTLDQSVWSAPFGCPVH